jgi:segregation and condensation protein B
MPVAGSKTINEIDEARQKSKILAKQSISSSKTIDEIDSLKEKEDLKILEAVFFISGRFLNMQELISLSDLNPIILGDLIERLKDKYNKEESALEIFEKSGMWKMDVRQEYTHIINKLATGNSEFTKAEQETLAIIAFKHPIKQSVIIKIRGNKAYDHIKKFSDLGLIKKKKAGHTHELSLSEDFYDYFSISESDRTSVPGLSEEINKEIEEAEKEVKAEEAEGKFEDEEEKSIEKVPENQQDNTEPVEEEPWYYIQKSEKPEKSKKEHPEENSVNEEDSANQVDNEEQVEKNVEDEREEEIIESENVDDKYMYRDEGGERVDEIKQVKKSKKVKKDKKDKKEKDEYSKGVLGGEGEGEGEEVRPESPNEEAYLEKVEKHEESNTNEAGYSKGVLSKEDDSIKELRKIAEYGDEDKKAKKRK